MIRVSIDPSAARARYGVVGELAATAASNALERGLEATTASSRQKTIGDVVLGVTILGALGALAWWSRGERAKKKGGWRR